MPKGVEVLVDNGFAEIDFVDRSLRGPGLRKLLAVTPPELVETLTRSGPRRRYRVPEGNARAAGLLDSQVKSLPAGDTGASAALAEASPAGARPDPQTVKGRAYGSGQGTYTGPLRPGTGNSQLVTSTDDVLGVTSVQTTLVPGSGVGGGNAPSHADVIARVKAAGTVPAGEHELAAGTAEGNADPEPAKKAPAKKAAKKAPAKTAAKSANTG